MKKEKKKKKRNWKEFSINEISLNLIPYYLYMIYAAPAAHDAMEKYYHGAMSRLERKIGKSIDRCLHWNEKDHN